MPERKFYAESVHVNECGEYYDVLDSAIVIYDLSEVIQYERKARRIFHMTRELVKKPPYDFHSHLLESYLPHCVLIRGDYELEEMEDAIPKECYKRLMSLSERKRKLRVPVSREIFETIANFNIPMRISKINGYVHFFNGVDFPMIVFKSESTLEEVGYTWIPIRNYRKKVLKYA